MRPVSLSILLLAAACGGPESPPARAPSPPPAAAPREPPARRPPGSVWREDVDAALARGLGYFLQHVRVEPVLDEGRFVGWEIVEIAPPDYFGALDLLPGDVVTRVNNLPIEREFQAHAAFESLRHTKQLRVSYRRGGEPRELVLDIVPREGSAAPRSTARPSGSVGSPPASSAQPSSKSSAPAPR